MAKQKTIGAGGDDAELAHLNEPPPDWVNEGTGGFESVDATDLVLPRLQICQSLSPEREEGDPKLIVGLKEGDWFNSVSKEIYGPGPILLTPLLCSKSRIQFPPKDSGAAKGTILCMGIPTTKSAVNPEGISCRSNDGGPCLHPDFDDEARCSLLYNFPVVVHTHPNGPMVLSFKSTGVRTAKSWLSMMRIRGRFPMYAMAFAVQSVITKSPKGTYRSAKIDNAGWTPQHFIDIFKMAYEGMKDKVVLTDADTDAEEREAGEEG